MSMRASIENIFYRCARKDILFREETINRQPPVESQQKAINVDD